MKGDLNKDGKMSSYEKKRDAAIKRAMGNTTEAKDGKGKGKGTHKTKDGRTAKKGLWYNIHKKKKAGKKMRKKGEKGAPTEKAIKRSQKTSKKP